MVPLYKWLGSIQVFQKKWLTTRYFHRQWALMFHKIGSHLTSLLVVRWDVLHRSDACVLNLNWAEATRRLKEVRNSTAHITLHRTTTFIFTLQLSKDRHSSSFPCFQSSCSAKLTQPKPVKSNCLFAAALSQPLRHDCHLSSHGW